MKIKEDSALDRVRKPARIGPSDTSDTIADRPGERLSDSDAEYTGERANPGIDPHAELHEAEEAQLGVTDEELEAAEAEDEADLVKTPPEND